MSITENKSKKLEEHKIGTLTEIAMYYEQHPPKGEIVIVIKGKD